MVALVVIAVAECIFYTKIDESRAVRSVSATEIDAAISSPDNVANMTTVKEYGGIR